MWLLNLARTFKNIRAVKAAQIRNGKMIWARFSVVLTSIFSAIELGFVLIGIISMTSEPGSGSTLLLRSLIAGIFITCSAGLTVAAFPWRQVDYELIRRGRDRAGAQATGLASQRVHQFDNPL